MTNTELEMIDDVTNIIMDHIRENYYTQKLKRTWFDSNFDDRHYGLIHNELRDLVGNSFIRVLDALKEEITKVMVATITFANEQVYEGWLREEMEQSTVIDFAELLAVLEAECSKKPIDGITLRLTEGVVGKG